MRHLRRTIVAIAGVTVALAFARVAVTSGAVADEPVSNNAEPDQRNLEIGAWGNALAADSTSAVALAQLAGLHLQRGRETGSDSDMLRAEQYARRSLANRVNRNGKTYVTLATALVASHRFAEAEEVAEQAVAYDPAVPEYRALLAEVKLELADYEGARPLFDSLAPFAARLSIAARLSRWAEINGETGKAYLLMRKATERAAARPDLPQEQVAWFHFRLGDMEMRRGRLRRAEAEFRKGLERHPSDYRILAAMSRLALVNGKPHEAIEFGELALATKVEPRTLWVLAEAYLAIGDTVRAAESVNAMDFTGSAQAQYAADTDRARVTSGGYQ